MFFSTKGLLFHQLVRAYDLSNVSKNYTQVEHLHLPTKILQETIIDKQQRMVIGDVRTIVAS